MRWELFMFKHLHISVANGKSCLFKNGIHLQHQIDWNLAVLLLHRNFYKIQIRIGGAMRCHWANSLPEWVDTTNHRIPHMMSYISWFACKWSICWLLISFWGFMRLQDTPLLARTRWPVCHTYNAACYLQMDSLPISFPQSIPFNLQDFQRDYHCAEGGKFNLSAQISHLERLAHEYHRRYNETADWTDCLKVSICMWKYILTLYLASS